MYHPQDVLSYQFTPEIFIHRVLGFSTSLMASPNKFQHKTNDQATIPGAISIHGTTLRALMLPASNSIVPKLGRGGWIPNPSQLKMISVPINVPIPIETVTTIGPIAFGKR
jgi:hypothetical protein